MSEPVFIIRGIPSGGDQLLGRRIIEDVRVVGDLEEDLIRQLCDSLETAKGFLAPSRLFSLIKKRIPDKLIAGAVFRVLLHLIPADLEDFFDHVEEWRNENQGEIPDEGFKKLKKNLKLIIRPYAALERFRKAERLEKVTGQALEDVQLICDLRPIFDEEREVIEGMFPFTTLRIVAEGADGLPVATEFELSRQQVEEFAEKAQVALKKLRTLTQQTEKWIPGGVPNLTRTRSSERESGND